MKEINGKPTSNLSGTELFKRVDDLRERVNQKLTTFTIMIVSNVFYQLHAALFQLEVKRPAHN